MASSKKRSRADADESRAECPFTIRLVDPREKEQKQKKRRKPADSEEEETKKNLNQLSPFAPTGKFKTYDTMDVHYVVEPAKKWSEMTRYNSFVLNGIKYFSEGFIYIANESSIERQKALANKEPLSARKKSEDDWVARILEIRASDEHHVYARVYWMYWPDELPPHTIDGKKTVQGRQPYHGQMELIASNHMDIINVVSVTSQAQVNQMIEDNDDDVQSSLYWRQAFDVRTYELSAVESVCKCGQPANPDKTLIGCSKDNCGKWLHSDCLKHEALIRVYERLGRDKPHIPPEGALKEENDGDEAKRPLSPKETGGAVSAQQSIDVKADRDPDSLKVDNLEVKDIKPEGGSAISEGTPTIATPTELEHKLSKKSTSVEPSSTRSTGASGSTRKLGKPRRKGDTASGRPYESLFEANIKMDLSPPMMEITDLREGIDGGQKTWLEPMECLICSSPIV